VLYGAWLDTLLPGTSNVQRTSVTDAGASGEISECVREQVAISLWDLGFAHKDRAKAYQKPYPEFFDSIPCPRGFRVPDFLKFIGDDSRTTYEHVGQYLAQVSDAGITDTHQVKLFPLSLSHLIGSPL
jgi:hypothetical protein